ncbi:MAG: hypothetical protein QM564_07090 [Bergeyella sp.]
MVAEIENYIKIQNSIDDILKNSPFKMSYIIEKTGIKKPTFFKKLKEKRFTSDELLTIAKIVEPVYRNETKEEILESLKRAEEDIKNGRFHTHEEVMNRAKARLEAYKKSKK